MTFILYNYACVTFKLVSKLFQSGVLRFCGGTEFAAGLWAGIELDEPAGKNDGGVGGVPYFRCPPKHGIFAPINKISKPGILVGGSGGARAAAVVGNKSSTLTFGKVNTAHITSRIDTGK